jgi:hypothetical protein
MKNKRPQPTARTKAFQTLPFPSNPGIFLRYIGKKKYQVEKYITLWFLLPISLLLA